MAGYRGEGFLTHPHSLESLLALLIMSETIGIDSGQTGKPGSLPIKLVVILTKQFPQEVEISEALLNSKSTTN